MSITIGKTLILCKSIHHQNTAQIARVMAVVLDADLACPEEISTASLVNYRLVGFGSGVYYGRLHKSLYDRLVGLPDCRELSKPAFVFSTSGLPFLSNVWHSPLKRLLRRKGFDVVAEFSCRGFDTWGPLWLAGGLNRKHPDDRDLEDAREFAKGLAT
jgi:flavodoxin